MNIPILAPNSTTLLFVTPSKSVMGYVVQVALEAAVHTADVLNEPQNLRDLSGAVVQLVIAHLTVPSSVPLVCIIEGHGFKVQARRKRWALARDYEFKLMKEGNDGNAIFAAPDKWIFSVY